MAKNSDNHGTGEHYASLINEIKTSLDTHLREMLSKMFIDADELLFEKADNAASNEDRNRYFELMRNLRELKTEISVDFLENIKPYLRPFAETQSEKNRQKHDTEGELSLIGQQEMEDMVLIKSMSGSANGWFREAISHLEARLEHLALKTPEIFYKDAISPLNICQAFDDALADNFDIVDKKVLFQMFNDKLLSKMDTVYDVINNLLIEAGVLPQIKLHTIKSKTKQKPAHTDQPVEEPYEADDYQGGGSAPYHGSGQAATGHGSGAHPGATGGQPATGYGPGAHPGAGESFPQGDGSAQPGEATINQGGYAMTAAPGHTHQGAAGRPGSDNPAAYAGGHQGGAGNMPTSAGAQSGAGESFAPGDTGSQQAAAGMAGGQSGTGDMSASAGGNSGAGTLPQGDTPDGDTRSTQYQHQTAGLPASAVSESISDFIGTPLTPGATPGVEGPAFPASTPQYYGHQEILEALSGIQLKPEFNESKELVFNSEAIKRAVLSQISSTSGGLVTKRINRIAEKTIDFIELIFDAIIDDTDISDTIKALLLRLQIPIIKASMMDQEFFIYDDHPARVLLDRITEVGIGVTEHSDEVYIFLNGIITKLVNEFELQTSSFENALDELNKYVEERDAQAQAKEEESQRQVLREHARNLVLKSLRDITKGKTLPEPIHPLVLKRWPTLMFNHYLNHGKENDEWITVIEVLREIIESVQPLTTAEELLDLQLNRDRLVDKTLEYLNRTNQSKKDIEKVIQGLIDVHQLHVENASFTEEEQEHAAEEVSIRQQEHEDEEQAPAEVETQPVVEQEPAPKLPSNIMPGMWFQVYMGDEQIARRCKLSVIIIQDSKLVFVNYQGEIIVEKNIEEFGHELEEGTSKLIMGHSVFDHALNRVISNISTKH